jgi:hypothetical protein
MKVRDGRPTMTDTAVPLPDTGVIFKIGEYLATVTARGIDYELPYQRPICRSLAMEGRPLGRRRRASSRGR